MQRVLAEENAMFACVVQKPDGKIDFYFAEEDDQGQPIVPAEYRLITMSRWTPAEEEPDEFSLGCSPRLERFGSVSMR